MEKRAGFGLNGLRITGAAVAIFAGAIAPGPVRAEMSPTLSFYGVPGVIDMPSADAMKDGAISIGLSNFGDETRLTLSFQITPRLSGSFRTTATRNWDQLFPLDGYDTYTDRSFDLRYQLLTESEYLPALTIGLQDFAGTGLSSAEYIVATKTFSDRFKVTAGLGWGRLGSYGSIGAPFGTRPEVDLGQGGKPNPGQWFKGDVAPFAGIEWKINDRWTFKAEYSSDDYVVTSNGVTTALVDHKSPLNFGLEYARGDNVRLGLYSLYGSEVGFALNIVLDPKRRPATGVVGAAPVAVGLRPAASEAPLDLQGGQAVRSALAKRLAVDGMVIEDLSYTGTTAHLRIRNTTIDAGPQAIGRAARALSHVMPASVEVFEIVPVVNGMGTSKVTIRRSDLEALEHVAGNDSLLRERVQIADAGSAPEGGLGSGDLYPKFTWALGPSVRISQPLVGEVGLRFSASYEFRPGLILSGSVYKGMVDTLDDFVVRSRNESPYLQNVRSDIHDYNLNGDPSIDRLTLAWYAKPAENLYSRVTLGYLERMHGGISGELLWKPVDSRLALGLELNYTKQRDTDGGFGFGEYDYGVATGHVSAYYDFGDGFLGQVDVGRYLAGDYGATFALDREFANGVKVGAYATFTTASAEEFGEGSFDKGIRLTIPVNWVLGQPSRKEFSTTVRALQRDGGARLEVDGRLFESIRDYHLGRLDTQWGRVWR